jgi:hypothetical protein
MRGLFTRRGFRESNKREFGLKVELNVVARTFRPLIETSSDVRRAR